MAGGAGAVARDPRQRRIRGLCARLICTTTRSGPRAVWQCVYVRRLHDMTGRLRPAHSWGSFVSGAQPRRRLGRGGCRCHWVHRCAETCKLQLLHSSELRVLVPQNHKRTPRSCNHGVPGLRSQVRPTAQRHTHTSYRTADTGACWSCRVVLRRTARTGRGFAGLDHARPGTWSPLHPTHWVLPLR